MSFNCTIPSDACTTDLQWTVKNAHTLYDPDPFNPTGNHFYDPEHLKYFNQVNDVDLTGWDPSVLTEQQMALYWYCEATAEPQEKIMDGNGHCKGLKCIETTDPYLNPYPCPAKQKPPLSSVHEPQNISSSSSNTDDSSKRKRYLLIASLFINIGALMMAYIR